MNPEKTPLQKRSERYHLTPVRRTTVAKKQRAGAGKDVESREAWALPVGRSAGAATAEERRKPLQKVKNRPVT